MPYISRRRVGHPNKIEQKEANVRHNNKWGKYYHNKQWKQLREWQITNYPLCYDCALNGRSVPAEEVHHSIVFSWFDTEEDKMKALLCPDFLVSLCRKCHMERHKHLVKPDNFKETKEYKMIHNSCDIY